MNRNSSLLDLFDSDNEGDEGNRSKSKTENIIEDNGNLIQLKLPKLIKEGSFDKKVYFLL